MFHLPGFDNKPVLNSLVGFETFIITHTYNVFIKIIFKKYIL